MSRIDGASAIESEFCGAGCLMFEVLEIVLIREPRRLKVDGVPAT